MKELVVKAVKRLAKVRLGTLDLEAGLGSESLSFFIIIIIIIIIIILLIIIINIR